MLVNPAAQAPARKPLPQYVRQPSASNYINAAQQAQIQQQQAGSYGNAGERGGAGRFSSSSQPTPPSAYIAAMSHQQQAPITQYQQFTRRTLSNATSTSSTSTNTGVARATTGSQPRRSTSNRSTASASPTSYVALMRKQKATVWCDRAQTDDPRILAARRQAKMRAAMEVAGSTHLQQQNARAVANSSSGGMRSKIRHHGAVKAQSYQGGPNLSGAGVPMRLSASEVDEGDSDEEPELKYTQRYHQRDGSGRWSQGSGGRTPGQYASGQKGAYSNGSTPPTDQSPSESMGQLAEEQTPVPRGPESDDYFRHAGGQGGSGESIQREDNFGTVSQLPVRTVGQHQQQPHQQRETTEDLMRRGSVDERTMTMSAVRLFIANPDRDE